MGSGTDKKQPEEVDATADTNTLEEGIEELGEDSDMVREEVNHSSEEAIDILKNLNTPRKNNIETAKAIAEEINSEDKMEQLKETRNSELKKGNIDQAAIYTLAMREAKDKKKQSKKDNKEKTENTGKKIEKTNDASTQKEKNIKKAKAIAEEINSEDKIEQLKEKITSELREGNTSQAGIDALALREAKDKKNVEKTKNKEEVEKEAKLFIEKNWIVNPNEREKIINNSKKLVKEGIEEGNYSKVALNSLIIMGFTKRYKNVEKSAEFIVKETKKGANLSKGDCKKIFIENKKNVLKNKVANGIKENNFEKVATNSLALLEINEMEHSLINNNSDSHTFFSR